MEKTKIYSPSQVLAGGVFAGPIAASYMVTKNFDSLGRSKEARLSVFYGAILSLILLSCGPFVVRIFPLGVSKIIIPLVSGVVGRQIVEQYQISKAALAASGEYETQSGWLVAGVIVLSALFTVLLVFVSVFALIQLGVRF